MTLRFCDGATFYRAVLAAVATLDRHAAEVDSLNVFPVPDGDTGRNMLVTMRVALEHAEALDGPERTLTGVADALAHGALMGGRGNSGVILSQVLRGVAEGVKGMRRADGLALAHALRCGSRAADAAVPAPVEGTILTVVRAAGDAAVAAGERDPSLATVLSAAVSAAADAVLRTPDQLPALAEAGVVDAGGRGFELLLRGILVGMAEAPESGVVLAGAARGRPVPTPDGDVGWGYETMYLLTAREGTTLDIERMRTQLLTMGDSVLVVGDAHVARIHLHSERPDLAIGFGLRRGTVSRVTVENMDLITAGEREERAAELLSVAPAELARLGGSGQGLMAGRAVTAPQAPIRSTVSGPAADDDHDGHDGHGIEVPLVAFGIVAVVPGPGFARAFQAAGVRSPLGGGLGEGPSTGDLVAAIHAAAAETVAVLPNNPNVRLAADQAAALSTGIRVYVLPTRNAAEGLAAVLALDPRADPEANLERMRRAAAGVRTFSVTRAVRDVTLGGRRVRIGDAIALGPDDGLLAVGRDRVLVAVEAARGIAGDAELLTIHYGADADLDESNRLAAALRAALPTLEVEVMHGGQPHHAFLVAAE